MSDGFPMDRYGRSEKHISFAFTLKADTQLGREKEEMYLLLSSPDRDHRTLLAPLQSARLLIKNSFKNSQSPSLAGQ